MPHPCRAFAARVGSPCGSGKYKILKSLGENLPRLLFFEQSIPGASRQILLARRPNPPTQSYPRKPAATCESFPLPAAQSFMGPLNLSSHGETFGQQHTGHTKMLGFGVLKSSLKPLPRGIFGVRNRLQAVAAFGLPLVLQGLSANMRPLLWGLFGCAILLTYSLWPVAQIPVIWVVNRRYRGKYKSKNLEIQAVHMQRLEGERRALFAATRAVSFGFVAIMVGLLLRFFVGIVIDNHFNDERMDVSNRLTLDTITPRSGNLYQTQFTIRNTSDIDIGQYSIRCGLYEIVGAHYITRSNTIAFVKGYKDKLEAGGDGMTVNCAGGMQVTEPRCFDIFVLASYELVDQPGKTETKSFRVVADRNNGWSWVKQPLNNSSSYCIPFDPPELKGLAQ